MAPGSKGRVIFEKFVGKKVETGRDLSFFFRINFLV